MFKYILFDMNSNIKFPLNASNSFIERIIIDACCLWYTIIRS